MIYSGLEFGQYFELERNTNCHNVLLALTPATRMAFIFIQMYFIFLNDEVGVKDGKIMNIIMRFMVDILLFRYHCSVGANRQTSSSRHET